MENNTTPLAGTVFNETLRGGRCIRLSVLTDETTSPERQREACDRAAAFYNIDFGAGDDLREVVDLDLSASKLSPFAVRSSACGCPCPVLRRLGVVTV
ncbi:hypothetical protein [Streptomyces caatingaensis]|nr:hypothetical protein [Streptomyces caatingaensis]